MTRRARVGLVCGAILAAFLLYEGVTSIVAYTGDAYVRSDLVAVAAQVTGRVVAVRVSDNQTVARGDVLFNIDPVPFQLGVAQRHGEIEELQAQLRSDQAEIGAARDALEAAASTLTFAVETQRRVAALNATNDATRAELDRANDELHRAQADKASADAAVSKAESTAAMHQAALSRAEAELGLAEWRLARTTVVAPTSGSINNLTLRVGDTATADEPLVGIVDATGWRIVANYKQNYIRGFRVGGDGWVWLDSMPWHWWRARITGIARGISREPGEAKLLPYVEPTTDWIRLQRRFPVTLILNDPPPDLHLYMGADARVVIFP